MPLDARATLVGTALLLSAAGAAAADGVPPAAR
ncbi:MAG: hypothetical protein JWO31_332, partial [Phycisphaerales bacterium]|nr:hypothetical protein [Phycisphaerales bacterium]